MNKSISSFHHLARFNTFIYKGYNYDVESGHFMKEHRYYYPEWRRFIQPADVSNSNPHSINGLNLYTYANNNPVSAAYSVSGGSVYNGMVNFKWNS